MGWILFGSKEGRWWLEGITKISQNNSRGEGTKLGTVDIGQVILWETEGVRCLFEIEVSLIVLKAAN